MREFRSHAVVPIALGLVLFACRAPAGSGAPSKEPIVPPRTVAEESGGERTSTFDEVLRFLDALERLPRADRLARRAIGTTSEGRELQLVAVADPMPADFDELARTKKLKLLVNANIHGGEVEGKEAVLALLREFALGEHAELLEQAVVLFVPVYNADGNDRIDPANRATQNGPDAGVGERANAQDLDLNRDFVKVESPECAALMSVFRTFDPHLFLDLHTTNGSYHGYHLTYSPSLSPNVEPALDAFARDEWIAGIRAAMEKEHGYRTFDYGNFTEGDERTWATYDHRPRFGTNYYALRNRLALLSEAYSYCDFPTRIAATRAFVLETLRACVAHADRIRELCAAADRRIEKESVPFGWSTELAPPVPGEVLVGAVDALELPEGRGTRYVARPDFQAETMGVQDRFVAREMRGLPLAWAVLAPSDAVRRVLEAHGIELEVLDRERTVLAARFRTSRVSREERPFQGHRTLALEGDWERETETLLPAGTLLVHARARLGRVAAQLLEPRSEDSLVTWNFLDQVLGETGEAFPVLRVLEDPAGP